MADLKASLKRLHGNEGFYANDPSDSGGETYCGISRKNNPSWSGWRWVNQLRGEPGFPNNLQNHGPLNNDVEILYRFEYWNKIKGDLINDQAVADELFDTGVNMGIAKASFIAQHALNLMNRNGQSYADIKEDMIIGNETLGLLNACKEKLILQLTLNALQASHYIALCERKPDQEKFFRSWIKRCAFNV